MLQNVKKIVKLSQYPDVIGIWLNKKNIFFWIWTDSVLYISNINLFVM